MKKIFALISAIVLLSIAFHSCQKKDNISSLAPTVETASVDEIYNTTARVGGSVTEAGGSEVTSRGVYWGRVPDSDTSWHKLELGKGTGIFYDTLTGLTKGTKYYVKAFAVNTSGTAYGTLTFFTTQINLPTVNTSPVADLQTNSAKVGGNVSDDGGYSIIKRGIYWGNQPDPVLTGNRVELDTGKGAFSYTLTELDRAYRYYVVAFATNIRGTSYGQVISFTTQSQLPGVSTSGVQNIRTDSATVRGNVSSDGGSTVTERGIYWGANPSPETSGVKLALGNGTGSFLGVLAGLTPGTTYYFKAYATNALGTSFGEEMSFLTLGKAPTVRNIPLTALTSTSVTLHAVANANELSTTVSIEYGTTTSYGSTADAGNNPATKTADTMNFSLSGLSPNTVYYYRVKAVNSLGTAYSNDTLFRTVLTGETGTVTDIDNNTYHTIGIGYQVWMTENLRVASYRNGIVIPKVAADTSWAKLSTPAYCWYNNDSVNFSHVYGALYNWTAVNADSLCPNGWHVPTNDEVTQLVNYVGGAGSGGGALKATTVWNSPNTGATDSYGFAGLPGGMRYDNGAFDLWKVQAYWWTQSDYSTLTSSGYYLLYNYPNAFQGNLNKKYGLSVRCVKN